MIITLAIIAYILVAFGVFCGLQQEITGRETTLDKWVIAGIIVFWPVLIGLKLAEV